MESVYPISRSQYYAELLPVIQAIVCQRDERNPRFPLGIVGPTEDELRAFAPLLLENNQNPGATAATCRSIFPIGNELADPESLFSDSPLTTDKSARWLIVDPPGTEVDLSGLTELSADLRYAFETAGSTFALCALLGRKNIRMEQIQHIRTYMLVPESTLRPESASAELRSMMLRSFLHLPLNTVLHDHFFDEPPDWTDDHEKRDYIAPQRVWSVDCPTIGPMCFVDSLRYTLRMRSLRYACHFRRLKHHDLRCSETIKRCWETSRGDGIRDDSDAFVPLGELFYTNDWTHRVAYNQSGCLSRSAESLGYPMKRLGDVARVSRLADASLDDKLFILMDLNGEYVTRAQTCSKSSWDRLVVDDGATKYAVIQTNDEIDATFLCGMLTDTRIGIELKCRGSRSYNDPTIAPADVANLCIPWPSPQRRKEHLNRRKEIEKVAATEREKIERAMYRLECIASDVGSPPWRIDEAIIGVKQAAQRVSDAMSQFDPRYTRPAMALSHPGFPGPLAIMRRELRNVSNPHEAIKRWLDLGETSFKYDTCVLLALLHHIPGECRNVFCDLRNNELGSFDFTLGSWQKAGELGRSALKNLRDRLPSGRIRRFARQVTKSQIRHDDKLLKERNDYAHSNAGDTADANRRKDRLRQWVDDMQCDMAWAAEYALFVVEAIEPHPKKVVIDRRMLIGDNPVYEVQRIERPPAPKGRELFVQKTYLDLVS